jgi:hypothetical protein
MSEQEVNTVQQSNSTGEGLTPERESQSRGYSLNTLDPRDSLPEYQCHKRVKAIQIHGVVTDAERASIENRATDGGVYLLFRPAGEQKDFEIREDAEYLKKHNPQPGGYYVVYEDGYRSFSPAGAFESGYSPVEPVAKLTALENDCDYVLRFKVPFGSHKRGDTNKFSGKLSEKIYNYDTMGFKYSDLLSAGIIEIVSIVPLEK